MEKRLRLLFLFIGYFIQVAISRPAKQPKALLQILPNSEQIVVQSGDDVTISCIGDQYLSWEYSTHSYSHPDELRHDIDNRLLIDSYPNDGVDYPSEYTQVSTVRILNATFLDTGYITCLNEDDQLVRIYVYVRDPNHLWSIIPTPTGSRVLDVVGGSRVTIPCRPTDPNVAVLLKESDVQVYPSGQHRWVAYDPREGFIIGSYPFRRDTEFECIAQLPRLGKTETFSFYVRVDDNIGGSHVSPSAVRGTSEEVTFLGQDSPSLPEASFQDMLPLSISELVAPEPSYDKKTQKDQLDQSFFGYQQDSAESGSHFPAVQTHDLIQGVYGTNHSTDEHFVADYPFSRSELSGDVYQPGQLVAPVHSRQPEPDYADYALSEDHQVSTSTEKNDIVPDVAVDDLVLDSTVPPDSVSPDVPSDSLYEETEVATEFEVVETSTQVVVVQTEATPALDVEDSESVEVSVANDETIEDATPAVVVSLPDDSDQEEATSTTVKEEVNDNHVDDLEDLIIPDEDVDDFLKLHITTTTEVAVTQVRGGKAPADTEDDPYDNEALESRIEKSVAFTVGAESTRYLAATLPSTQAAPLAAVTPLHRVLPVSAATLPTASPIVRKSGNPVQAASPQEVVLPQGKLLSSSPRPCEHASNGKNPTAECSCDSSSSSQKSSAQNQLSQTASSQIKSGNGKNNVLTLQPTVTKIGNGQTKIGGSVQFECTIVVSEEFDLVLEWSHPDSISKERIHVSPQTVSLDGNGMKTMRSVLTNRNFQRGDVGPYVCIPTLVTAKSPAALVRPRQPNGNGNGYGHSKQRLNGHQYGIQTVLGPRPTIIDKTDGRNTVGGNFILECSAAHTKRDTILELLWKIPYDVEKSGRSSITPNTERNGRVYSTMTVRNLQLSDKGNYTCIAEEIHPENGILMTGGGSNLQLE